MRVAACLDKEQLMIVLDPDMAAIFPTLRLERIAAIEE
jgi:hypothetical protein